MSNRKPPPKVNLSGLPNRFEMEQRARKIRLQNVNAVSDADSELIYDSMLHIKKGFYNQQWFSLLGSQEIHKVLRWGNYFYDANKTEIYSDLGINKPIQTYCGGSFSALDLLKSMENKTLCMDCLKSNFGEYVHGKLKSWQVSNSSWTEGSLERNKILPAECLNLGFAQPIRIPQNTDTTSEWMDSIASSWGINSLLLVGHASKKLALEIDSEDLSYLKQLVSRDLATEFECISCKTMTQDIGINEEHQSPMQFSPYKRAITVGSIIRLGPRTFCNSCRSKTYGDKTYQPTDIESIVEAIKHYKDFFNCIPDRDWVRRPICLGMPDAAANSTFNDYFNEALSVTSKMPDFFSGSQSPNHLKMHPQIRDVNWWQLLHEAGLVQKFKKTPRGLQGEATDGHWCLSLLEWKFCNLLNRSQISHEKEPRYGTSNLMRADYKIGDLFVEIAGLLEDEKYKSKIYKKLTYARENRRRVLVLLPAHIHQLDKSHRITTEEIEKIWKDEISSEGLSSLAFSF